MRLHTRHVPDHRVHVTYTSDALAVNRWIRRVVYGEAAEAPAQSFAAAAATGAGTGADAGVGVGAGAGAGAIETAATGAASVAGATECVATSAASHVTPGAAAAASMAAAQLPRPPSPKVASPPPHPPLHIGLDVEWKANRARGEDNHVAVVQLATRRHVLVFHTHLCTLPPGVSGAWARRAALAENTATGEHRHAVPLELARLFCDTGVRFVGVGVRNDFVKCVKDFALSAVPLWQLVGSDGVLRSEEAVDAAVGNTASAALAAAAAMPPPPLSATPISGAPPPTHSFAVDRVVEMSERWLVGRRIAEGHGLKALSVRVLSLTGWVARSNGTGGGGRSDHSQWELPLAATQIRYAALDAWASAVVHDVLECHEQRMPEREEMARRDAANAMRRVVLRALLFGCARMQDALRSGSAGAGSGGSLGAVAAALGPDTESCESERERSAAAACAAVAAAMAILPPVTPTAVPSATAAARLALRETYSAAMGHDLVKRAAESDEMRWFERGALTQPPVGGVGHNRECRCGAPVPRSPPPRAFASEQVVGQNKPFASLTTPTLFTSALTGAKKPFPKPRRRPAKARISPDPRFIVDVRQVLGLVGSGGGAGGSSGPQPQQQLTVLQLARRDCLFASDGVPEATSGSPAAQALKAAAEAEAATAAAAASAGRWGGVFARIAYLFT